MRTDGTFPDFAGGTAAVPAVLDAEGAELVSVPGGDLALTASYARSGPDLVLEGAGGQSVVLTGFFVDDTPPDLVTDGGAVIDGGWAARLAGPLAPAQVAQAGATAPAPIGTVSTAAGPVTIRHPDGTAVPAAKGTAILQGDVVETGKGGKVALTFVDKTTFSLGESGRMTIDEMVYDPGGASAAKMGVVQGVFSFVSGQVAKTAPEAMIIKTPVATIGVRGTSVAGKGAAEGSTNNFTLLKDPDGTVGEITVSNSAGVQVLSQPFQTTSVVSAYAPPSALVVLSPAVVGAFYGAVTDILPTPPIRDDRPAPERGPEEGRGEQAPEQVAEARDAAQAAQAGAEAAEAAFDQALAEGKSMEEAMVAAAKAAIEGAAGKMAQLVPEGIKAPQVESLAQIMKGDVGLFDLVEAGRDMGFITGPPQGVGPMPGIGPMPGMGPIPGMGPMALVNLDFGMLGFVPPPIFAAVQAVFVSVVTEAFISEGTISVFDEVLSGTSGDDHIVGGAGNTRITMAKGSTLGGTDVVDGGGGIDELTLTNLSDFLAIWNLGGHSIQYSDGKGGANTVYGSITIASIEQVYAADTSGTKVRLPLEDETTGNGYILAGTALNDTLSLVAGEILQYGSGAGSINTTVTNPYGSIIFAGDGNDDITGSAAQDIIYGGAGNDIIRPNGAGYDMDAVYGGDGDDTVIFANPGDLLAGSMPVGSFQGEAGIDTVQIGIGTTATGLVFQLDSAGYNEIAFAGFEKLHIYQSNTTVVGDDLTFFRQLTDITVEGAATGITIKSSDSSLMLANAASVDAGVTTLRATDYGSGVTIHDSTCTVGRALWGSDHGDRLYGYGGGDTYQLGATDGVADSAVDRVYLSTASDGAAAPNTQTGYDIIKGMGSSDMIYFKDAGFSAFDDVTANGVFAKTSVNAGDAISLSAYEMVFVDTTLMNSDLTQANFTNLVGALGTVTAGTATASHAQNDAILIVRASTDTGIYLYTNQDGASAGNTTIDADELTLVAVVENITLGQAQVEMVA